MRKAPPLLHEISKPLKTGLKVPALDVPKQASPPKDMVRGELNLPQVSQPEVVRYFTKLSQLNFSIDANFYPLGSCTMKYNPKVNEAVASAPGWAALHPSQPSEQVRGALQLLYELQGFLGEITGLPAVSLAPLAGAQGEFAGLSIVRSYLKDHGQGGRNIALIPDSAHGTNPASAAMAGMEVRTVASTAQGDVDLGSLANVLDDTVAVLMLTLPSTLGLFEPNILRLTKMVHDAGGLVYADGANLNALLGLARFGDLGFDICHSNLHKTFSTPHGGGGPGSGPVMVTQELGDYLPAPVAIKKADGNYDLHTPSKSIGHLSGYHGSFGILVRAYTYLRAVGGENLVELAENAIISANYIQTKLKDRFANALGDRYCMHETVLSATRQAKRGVKALDIAKRLLDFGVHSPTMYFPLIVPEALMVEPTEAESKATLDDFLRIMEQIDEETVSDPEKVKSAPHNLSVTRLDEATASRQPKLKASDLQTD